MIVDKSYLISMLEMKLQIIKQNSSEVSLSEFINDVKDIEYCLEILRCEIEIKNHHWCCIYETLHCYCDSDDTTYKLLDIIFNNYIK